MADLRAGLIGTGKMGHNHARGYVQSPDTDLVAVADISLENAQAFQKEYEIASTYTDYREMLEQEKFDIVSVCTWPHLHAPMVIACAEAGVRAVHCEKPMAPTYGDAKCMFEVCQKSGTQLSFNHQRRFAAPYRKAKELLKEGRIGELQRLEARTSNLFDWGTHWFDMMFYYNDDIPAEWLIGQVEPRDSRKVYGAAIEHQGLAYWKWQNNVYGMMTTGFEAGPWAENTLIGTEGRIEVGVKDGSALRIWGKGQTDWEDVAIEGELHGGFLTARSVQDVIDALKEGRDPELVAHRSLQATELIFATYESSRRRGRITLPLDIEDSPLEALISELESEA
jgi:predicted dehydrogenase